jgi:hypothetical protein
MRTLLKIAVAAGALWAVYAFVPVGGRTLQARWRAAPPARVLAERAWRDLTARLDAAGAPAVTPRPDTRPSRGGRPAESHTEADRRELDRLVADGLRR